MIPRIHPNFLSLLITSHNILFLKIWVTETFIFNRYYTVKLSKVFE